MQDDHRHGDTTVLRRRLGPLWQFWIWFAGQFSKTSLGIIGVLLVGGWRVYEHQQHIHEVQVTGLTTRVTVLEQQVVPDLKLKDKVAELELGYAKHDVRISNLESNYDFARQHAGDAPTRGRPRR